MKKFLSTVLALAMFLALCAVPAAAAGSVSTGTAKMGKATAQVSYVTMNSGTKIVPLIANGKIHTDLAADSIIKSYKGGNVVLAVNGGYFNSYYKAKQPLSVATNNYPRVYSTNMINGQIISGGGEINAMGMDASGNIALGHVKLQPVFKFRDVTATLWNANFASDNAGAIYALTDIFDYPINIPSSSHVVQLQGGSVISVDYGRNNYVTPDGVVTIVYNSSAWDNAAKWEKEPRVGDSAEYTFKTESSTYTDVWPNVTTVIGGGNILVENGRNVVDTNTTTDPKQKPDASGQRTFVAKMADGRFMFGTVNTTFRNIANSLVSLGAKDAICFDGGASSMMYANGKMITKAGRKLATVLAVVEPAGSSSGGSWSSENTGTSNKPVAPVKDEPSAWAAESIKGALAKGILPSALNSKFKTPITRAEFCDLVAGYIQYATGEDIHTYCTYTVGADVGAATFSDTSAANVGYIASLGIVTGYENGTFKPNSQIKRQDAAIILKRLYDKIGRLEAASGASPFADDAAISDYAKDGVYFCAANKIMNGNDKRQFTPQNNITREQAVITIMNMVK